MEGPVQASSGIRVADPQAASQLLSGFHEVEHGSWRWAAHEFAVTLSPPAQAIHDGGTLRLKFGLPGPVMKNGPVTLSGTVGSIQLAPQRFDAPGNFEYVRDVPPEAFIDDALRVSFATDRFLPPGNGDQRELALIVESISLETKKD